jgi:hypothetical protein
MRHEPEQCAAFDLTSGQVNSTLSDPGLVSLAHDLYVGFKCASKDDLFVELLVVWHTKNHVVMDSSEGSSSCLWSICAIVGLRAGSSMHSKISKDGLEQVGLARYNNTSIIMSEPWEH